MHSSTRRFERVARLVARPSVSSAAPGWDQSNREVIDELANQLTDVGFTTEVIPLPAAPEKANLIATLGKGVGGLVLAGHTDTVPYDASRWSSDPFRLSERDGSWYGLGTSDMKAFLALAVEAAEAFSADRLKAPLTVLATADEESSMDGARALVSLQRPKGRHAIIGEPTDNRAVRAHKGVMMERVVVHGRSGHASDPRLGDNAIEGMMRVLEALGALRAELSRTHRHPAFELPSPTLNFGRIHGGDSPNRICGLCEIDLDLRLLPGMSADDMRDVIREVAERAVFGTGMRAELHSLFEGSPAHELSEHAELVRLAEKLTGEGATSVAFATEAPYLAELGTDTIVMGPGSIAQAHRPDEFVRADKLEQTVGLLRSMIHTLCEDPAP